MGIVFDTADAYEKHYGVEGAFAYLKQFTVNDVYPLPDGTRKAVPQRVRNVFKKNNINSLYDLRSRTIGEIWQLENLGLTTAEQLHEWMKARHALVLDHSVLVKTQAYTLLQQAVHDVRSYADLQQDLPAFALAGQRAAQQDRHKPGVVVEDKRTVPSQAELDFQDQFIQNNITRQIGKTKQKNLRVPLSKVPQVLVNGQIGQLNNLAGRTDGDGHALQTVGDVVRNGTTGLLNKFHVSRKHMATLEVELHAYGYSFDLYRRAHTSYTDMIGDLTKQATAQPKPPRPGSPGPDQDV